MHDDQSEEALTELLIDREIRRVLDVNPSPEFLARVRARLADEPVAAASRVWSMLAAGAGVAAAIGVVLVLSRSGQRPAPTPSNPSAAPGKPAGDVSLASSPGYPATTTPPVAPRPAVSGEANQPASRSVRSSGAKPSLRGRPVRVGGAVKAPRKTFDVKPIYSEEARGARIGDTVLVGVIIAKDGSVANVRVVRSVPLLDRAVVDAVRRWKFEPTILNGVPVEVEMTVGVSR